MRSMLAMNKVLGILVAFGVLGISAMAGAGEEASTLVFSEPGFHMRMTSCLRPSIRCVSTANE